MKRQLKKLLGYLLTMSIILSDIPVIRAAAETVYTEIPVQTVSATEEIASSEEAYILYELVDKRDETTKYFAMSDGSTKACIYPQNIHYLKDGTYEEIDNTLVLQSVNEKSYYENSKNSFTVRIPESFTDDYIEFSDENGYVRFRLEGSTNKKIEKLTKTKSNGNDKTVVQNANDKAVFKSVKADVDIEYDLVGNKLKETIVLYKKTKNSFIFEVQTSVENVVKNNDGSVSFFDEQGKEIYQIASPYMMDEAGEYSNAIETSLIPTETGYRLIYTPDYEWLSAKERQYPVRIDPTLVQAIYKETVTDTYVSNFQSPSDVRGAWDVINIGRRTQTANGSQHLMRGLIRFEIPSEIGENDTIVDAKLDLVHYTVSSAVSVTGLQVDVHELAQPFAEGTAQWHNQPYYDPTIADYTIVNRAHAFPGSTLTYDQYNLTKLVSKWHNGAPNYGILLKIHDESTWVTKDQQVYYFAKQSKYYGSVSKFVEITYRNTIGLESYWNYSVQDFGQYGTGYVNNYNGNLVYVHGDTSNPALVNSFVLTHIYNSCLSNESQTVNGESGFYGRGFRLNLAQKLVPVTVTGNSSVKYKYTDGDGTEHYFVQLSDGKIVDEDGLGYTYENISESNCIRKITDKNGNALKFDSYGNLCYIVDSNGNQVSLSYAGVSNTNGGYLCMVMTDWGTTHTLEYDSSYRLTAIIDNASRYTRYRYTDGNLTEIEYPDGTVLRYEYTADTNKLQSIIAPDGKKLSYEYYPENGKVSAVKFYGKNNQLSSTLSFTYQQNQTKITDVEGRTLTYQFDTWGRPTCVYDDQQNIYSQTYTPTVSNGSGIFSNNKVATTSNGAVYVENLLKNPVFADGLDEWTIYNSSNAQITVDPNGGLLSPKVVKMNVSTTGYATIAQCPNIKQGKTYTLSGYLKTEDVASSTGGAGMEVIVYDDMGESNYYSEFLTGTTDVDIDNGYRKVSVTFFLEEDQNLCEVSVGLYGATGTVYIDSVQLEEGDTANNINLLENSSMEIHSGTGTMPYGFETYHTDDCRCVVAEDARSGDYSFKINGHPSNLRNVHQKLEISGKKGDIHSFGAWVKADSVPTNGIKQMSLSFCYEYTDGSYDWFEYVYNPYVSDWQFGQKVAIAKADYISMGIYFCYYKNCNASYCDNFFIYKDTSQSYRYDDDGNVISTSDYADQQSQFSYNGTTLSKMLDATGTGFEYYYDSNKNLVASKSSEGIINNIVYDSYGNPTSTSVYAKESGAAIQPGKTYYIQAKSSGEYLTVENGGTGSGTNVIEMPYTGGSEQRWKLVAAPKGGLYLCPENAPGMALHVYSPSSAYEYNVQIEAIDDSDNQKFTIVPKDNFTYQILQTSSEDGKILTINRSKTQVNATVLPPQGDCNPDQCWRIYEVEEGEPEAITDGVYQIRTRHTGKYLYHDSVTSGGYLVHNYYHEDSEVQDYWIERYNDTEYFTISPEESRGLYFNVSSVADGSGGTRIQLQSGEITDAKLFRFQYNTTLNAWQIISKANENRCIEVSLTYTNPYYYGVSNTNISGLNQGFILERLSDMITSSATYSWGGEVLESVTDSRGNTTTYEYDEQTFLLLGVTDARGTVTNYTYNEDNDRLEEVQTGNSVVSYQYEVDGAIKNITTPSGTVYQFVYDDFGRTTQIKVGNQVLSETAYKNVYSSLVSRMTYGNDVYRTYEYDDLDRLISEGINESTTRTYLYDKQSNLVQVQDFLANVTTKFQYDLIGRTVGINMSDGQSLRMIYDNYNRVSLLKWSLEEESFSTGYIYGDNTVAGQKTSLLYGVTLNGEQKIGYTYDELTRLESKTLATEVPFVTEYGYLEGSTAGTTTTLIKTVKNGNTTLEYAYDAVGNITSVKKNGVVIESYTYDALNQLTGATYGGNTYTYAYDNGGNITEVKKNGTVIKSYTYGNANWKDQLTAFNGETITYDKIGNPLTYRNNLSFTWQNGRQLATIMQGGNLLASYTYNADGLRTSKTVSGVTTEYYWMNGTLYAQKTGEEYIYFLYDESGIAYGFVVKNNTENAYYYYEFNLQGDIIGIINSAGTKVVEYTYGAWGDILSISGSMASTIGQKNPLRYRGYYYDGETGFYYLQSRYYDTEVYRFVNADTQLNTSLGIRGLNQFSYCLNNPVNMVDYDGNKPGDLFDTMDEAAKDAAIYLGALSFENGWEYITVIYSVNKSEKTYKTVTKTYRFLWWSWTKTSTKVIKTKVKKYTYKAVKTNKDPWSVNVPMAPLFRKRLATVHTHPMGSGLGITCFSEGDKKTADDLGLIDYVYGPNGELKKYVPSTGEVIDLFDDLPVSIKKPWLD